MKNLMYSHETEQPYRSWYLIINVFKLVNQSFHSLITTLWHLVIYNVVLLTASAFEVDN